jgi:hypothetical protein
MTYNLLSYLNTNRNLIIDQITAAYSTQFTSIQLLGILGLWYTTSEITETSDIPTINFTLWTHTTHPTVAYYTQSHLYYDITVGNFSSNAFEGTIQYGTGASSTDNGISSENLALLTLYYPVSNACFLKGASVETDQGESSIEALEPGRHTIEGNRIVAITKINGSANCLVKIVKNAISENVPNNDTILTRWHKVEHNNYMREAFRIPGTIRNIPYHGETLYNVLLDHHGKMKVNNMIVETLDPKNKTANFFTSE